MRTEQKTRNYALEAALSLGAFTAALFEHKHVAIACLCFTLSLMFHRLNKWSKE
jgi:hypothetical protein